MTSVRLEGFGGMLPRLSDRLLPERGAAQARNARLLSGELRGIRNPENIKEFGSTTKNAARLYKTSGTEVWWSSTNPDSDLVKGPLVNDSLERYYWIEGARGSAGPYVWYNKIDYIQTGSAGPYRLGTPGPSSAPGLTVTGGSGNTETRAYCYTIVNSWGEESQPSPTVTATGYINGSWDLSSLTTTMPDSTGRVAAANRRIYRTVTGQSSVEYFLVTELTMSGTTYSDTTSNTVVVQNSILQSWTWDVPPDTMEGLAVHPNGFLAGFLGSDLYFSVPYRPHAWPAAYVLSLEHPIVGLSVYNNMLTVMTEGSPYFAVGNHPNSIALNKSDASEPCLSKASIASTLQGVLYASQNGLVLFNEGGPQIITKDILTIEEWASYTPAAIRGAQQGNEYLGYHSTSRGFLFAPSEPFGVFSEIDALANVDNVIMDSTSGETWLLRSNTVYRWQPPSGIPMHYTWRSKEFDFPRPLNFGAYIVKMTGQPISEDEALLTLLQEFNDLRITTRLQPINFLTINSSRYVNIGTSPPGVEDVDQTKASSGGSPLYNIADAGSLAMGVILRVWADGVMVYDRSVNPNHLGRLPSGYKAHVWQFELTGNDDVYSLAVAEVPKELMNV